METGIWTDIIKSAPAPIICLYVVHLMVQRLFKFVENRDKLMAAWHANHLEARAASRDAMNHNAEATKENTAALRDLREAVMRNNILL